MTIGAPTLVGELARIVGESHLRPPSALDLSDETESRGLHGNAELVVLPGTAEEVRAVVAHCYESGVPIVPRGGGTGFAGGAVPLCGGIVLGLERLNRVRQFDPLLWRIQVEAGVRTAELRRIVRESGLLFPPDPGAAESSQIGGNIATNAGGPHAFKYGVTGAWVMGLEAVVPPGELIQVGGSIRKDVAGYDLKSLLIGSEGTLGIVTAAWLRLIPDPEAARPILALYPDVESGISALEAVLGNGLAVAALEYLDGRSMSASAGALPLPLPPDTALAVLVDVDGSETEAAALAAAAHEVLVEGALAVHAPHERGAVEQLWRWRDSVSIGVTAQRGGKVSEDIVIPVDRLAEALSGAAAIAARHGLDSCSWGHAGDGNLHATFLIDPADESELARSAEAAQELFALALELGGSVSGEHGIGVAKRGQLARQWAPRAVALHEAVKDVFDPENLLNPGKKLAR